MIGRNFTQDWLKAPALSDSAWTTRVEATA